MGKQLFIAEKPSVAREFAQTLGIPDTRGGKKGYMETEAYVVTWCFGHLVSMSYPDAYDPSYAKWSLDTLPFLPRTYRYEIISEAAEQFRTVSALLARPDVERIYVCTDSGREGEYIYRLVEMMSDPCVKQKDRRRVWIDSFTEEEIKRGIREAKSLSAYDHLADSAYLRAKEDYLMGINFSRVLTLRYGGSIAEYRQAKWSAVSVGRVMTCVLGMVVRREREIREFVKQPFYRVLGTFGGIEAEWKVSAGSLYENSPKLYKDNGLKTREDAEALVAKILEAAGEGAEALTEGVSRKTEKKNPPLLYNLAELQNDCSKRFKISPDQTLKIAQELYEKKLTTYPRTDARVLSSAVAKEIRQNLGGLARVEEVAAYAGEVLAGDAWKKIGKSRYTDDKAITDHYAIIPTGAGLGALRGLNSLSRKVYELIARRFLAVFYPPAVYAKTAAVFLCGGERFFANARVLKEPGYLVVEGLPEKAGGGAASRDAGKPAGSGADNHAGTGMDNHAGSGADNHVGTRADDHAGPAGGDRPEDGSAVTGGTRAGTGAEERMASLRKGSRLMAEGFAVKEGETSPPKRYTSGTMILAMENAGQLIEDDTLREQIRGSGIGTSATRADILAKLVKIRYLKLNKKTQVITPELLGEMVFDVVEHSIPSLLSPELTASWEKGLTAVAEGTVTTEEYMDKLEGFVGRRTNAVKGLHNQAAMKSCYDAASRYYRKQ